MLHCVYSSLSWSPAYCLFSELALYCLLQPSFLYTPLLCSSRWSLSLLARESTHPAAQPQNNCHILYELFHDIPQVVMDHLTFFSRPLFSWIEFILPYLLQPITRCYPEHTNIYQGFSAFSKFPSQQKIWEKKNQ